MYTINKLSRTQKIKKGYRFFKIYGLSRTYVKTIGRLRTDIPFRVPISLFKGNRKEIAVIGCGQFAFATLGFFLRKKLGKCFYGVYDINFENSDTFVRYYGGQVFSTVEELINADNVKVVYIASNHFTHTSYAIQALQAGKTVYLEKPISVNHAQLDELMTNYVAGKLFVGYNRPFSPAIITLVSKLQKEVRSPITLNFFVSGHKIPEDNWYRNKEEGTRVCGNIGHWIDATIHILNQIGLPKTLTVSLNASSKEEIDDNLSLTFVSEIGDLITIILTSRSEPFEGINESVNFQHGDIIAKIDDFRRLTIWQNDLLFKKRYFRKDVGHKNAIYQPFESTLHRDFDEIKISTLLMLEIKEALLNNRKEFDFQIFQESSNRT